MKPQVGDIIKIPLRREDNITPKHGFQERNKYCVVIGTPDFGYYVAYLIVDHAINLKFNPSKILIDNFFPLSKKDYPQFIEDRYDPSWLDLTEIREMEASRIEREGTFYCRLTDRDLQLILQTLKDSELITIKQKRRCNLL